MREHHLIICVLALTIGLATFSLPARADKLEDLDSTMQVIDNIEDLDKMAAYLRVPDADDGAADESAADDNASFDSDFEHDFDFEEDLMQDEDDFEDGDDVDDDLVSAPTATP